MKTLADVGEFGWIEHLRRRTTPGKGVRVGIGDDTAVLVGTGAKDLLFTTDMLIEGRHFRLSEATPAQIGRKALAVNLSDIAAMGGTPTHAVVSVGFPARTPLALAEGISKGMRVLAQKYRVNIVGGDTNRSDRVVISVALLGEAPKGGSVLRSGACPGDIVFVTGSLGGSYASKRHLTFDPRLAESHFLVKRFRPTAMMDISDGLASDTRRLAKASGVDILLVEECVPRAPLVKSTAHALSDGEDFELLFTLSPRNAARLTLARPKGLAPFTPVGKVLRGDGHVRLLRVDGSVTPLRETGFDHFR
jgi:thiamine-monophosphate kinase